MPTPWGEYEDEQGTVLPSDVLLLFLFIYWLHHAACGSLTSPEIKSVPPAVEVWSCDHWTAREVLFICFLLHLSSLLSYHLRLQELLVVQGSSVSLTPPALCTLCFSCLGKIHSFLKIQIMYLLLQEALLTSQCLATLAFRGCFPSHFGFAHFVLCYLMNSWLVVCISVSSSR